MNEKALEAAEDRYRFHLATLIDDDDALVRDEVRDIVEAYLAELDVTKVTTNGKEPVFLGLDAGKYLVIHIREDPKQCVHEMKNDRCIKCNWGWYESEPSNVR